MDSTELTYGLQIQTTKSFQKSSFSIYNIFIISSTGCLSDDICENVNSVLYCSSGCCGSYREHHCCSHIGLIIGIVVCVAVITAVVVIYCYLRHRNRKRTHAQTLICVPNARGISIVNSVERPRGNLVNKCYVNISVLLEAILFN